MDGMQTLFSCSVLYWGCTYGISSSVLDLVLFRVISNSLHADILFQKDLKLGRPWTGTDITDLGARYAAASKQLV
jgi:hypothetical protein